jgi:hypothetical protein
MVLQVVISELNTLTPLLNMALKVGIKWKALLVAYKLDSIEKVDTHPHVPQIKLAKYDRRSSPVSGRR